MITIESHKHVDRICKALDKIPCTDGTRGPLCGMIRQHTGKRDTFRYTKTNGHILVSFVTNSVSFREHVEKFYYATELDNGTLYQTAKEQKATAPNGVSGSYPQWQKAIPTFPCHADTLPYITFSASYTTILLNAKNALLDRPKDAPDIFVPNYTLHKTDQRICAKAQIYGDEIFLIMPLRMLDDLPHTHEDVSFFDVSESEFRVNIEKSDELRDAISTETKRIYADVFA